MLQDQPTRNGKIALVALGGNATSTVGDARETVLAGIRALGDRFDGMLVSHLYQTPAFPAGSGPDFVNAACAFTSEMSPDAILQILHDIEAGFGRERTLRWGQRTLDLDLISHGQQIAPNLAEYDRWRTLPLEVQKVQTPDALILPHPRVQDRPFVLIPLADVAPDWVHPVLGQTTVQMIAAHTCDARAEIQRLS